MIIYKGIENKGKVPYIIFENERKIKVEIPLEPHIAQRFLIYFDKIAIPISKPVERQNDELSE